MKRYGIMAALLLLPSAVRAQEAGAEREPAAILELGGAAERGIKGGPVGVGPSLSAEFTPIEGWLEIEGGVAPLFSRGQTEWDLDLLFKKPFTLSRHVEVMVGVGPSLSHVVAHGRTSDEVGAEAALDVMVWPWKGRRFGWYVEPSIGRSFASDHEVAIGISGGLLIPIGRRR